MLYLLTCAGWKAAWHKDMERQNVGDLMSLMGYSNARLSLDPPDPATMTAVLTCLTTGSVCTGTEAWPDSSSPDPTEVSAWTNVRTQLVILCRLASAERKAAETRLLARHRITPPVSADEASRLAAKSEEERKKNHNSEVSRFAAEAGVLYNRLFATPGETSVIMETRIAFDRNQLQRGDQCSSRRRRESSIHVD